MLWTIVCLFVIYFTIAFSILRIFDWLSLWYIQTFLIMSNKEQAETSVFLNDLLYEGLAYTGTNSHLRSRSIIVCVCFVCLFVLFLLAIVLSVLLRSTYSDYPVGIFKLSFNMKEISDNLPICQWPYITKQFQSVQFNCSGKRTWWMIDFWCVNATFSNISAISWRPVLVVEEAGENHRPWTTNW